ncbi:MAG TPA: glucuronyl hydrolase, partial [Bryobacteraceae bacterium]|nr:glucuronyl hydrolase [Bryobacteraceae bacterium]
EACARYFLTQSNPDGIPPWDFNAPMPSRNLLDTSAAAIAASALLRLNRTVIDRDKAHLYWSAAVLILRTLCQKHLARKDKKWEGILKGGVYHVHRELGVDESVMWGEYFFVEALELVLRQM